MRFLFASVREKKSVRVEIYQKSAKKKEKKEKEKKHERTRKTGLVEFLKENPYVPTYVHIQLGQKKLNKKQFKIQWTQHLSKSPV